MYGFTIERVLFLPIILFNNSVVAEGSLVQLYAGDGAWRWRGRSVRTWPDVRWIFIDV